MPSKPKKESNLSRFQNFESETINRSKITNAPYNPRFIDAAAKRRLKAGMRKHGLVQAITWNRRTGHVVGGHQRLEVLDELERRADYDLTVNVIDVDEREEVEVNVQLNNPSMQGEWDLEKLADLSEDFGLGFDDMGFSALDVDLMFDGDERFTTLFDTTEAENVKGDLDAVKEAREQGAANLQERNSISWYSIIVFRDEAERKEFHRRIAVPEYEEYVSVEQLERLKDS
ncbi:MAG: ParB N-terminal domain-containing protein [Raoultibacter sp.]